MFKLLEHVNTMTIFVQTEQMYELLYLHSPPCPIVCFFHVDVCFRLSNTYILCLC